MSVSGSGNAGARLNHLHKKDCLAKKLSRNTHTDTPSGQDSSFFTVAGSRNCSACCYDCGKLDTLLMRLKKRIVLLTNGTESTVSRAGLSGSAAQPPH